MRRAVVVLLKDSLGVEFELTLSQRIDELVRPYGGRTHSTAGTQAAIGRLEDRTLALEQAIREIARELEARSSPR